jgi:hypothetical protein
MFFCTGETYFRPAPVDAEASETSESVSLAAKMFPLASTARWNLGQPGPLGPAPCFAEAHSPSTNTCNPVASKITWSDSPARFNENHDIQCATAAG